MTQQNIPSDWMLCKQSEVATFYNGRAYKLSEWEKEGTPVIRLQNLTGSGTKFYYSTLELPERQYVEDGELLYMWSATFGPTVWRGEKAIYHYHIWKVECNEKSLNQDFMCYNLDYITESMKGKTNGSTMLHLTKKGMEEHEILVPPLWEQQKIAEVISTVDKKIDLIDQKITETQKLKTGLMQKLFSEGVGVQDKSGNWQPHTELKDSVYGKYPKKWAFTSFASLLKSKDIIGIQDGNHGESHPVSADFVPEGVPFITANRISRSNKLLTEKVKKITYEQYKSLRIGFSKPGDVILTHKGTIGLTAIVSESDGEIMLSPQTTYYRISEDSCLTNSFLYYFFQSSGFQKLLKQRSMQSTRAYIGIKKQAELDVFIPCHTEQERIVGILSVVDEKIELLAQQKGETQQLKKGLMQKLLTGELRVPLDDFEAA